MAIPMQPPSMTGISSAESGASGADAINVGGLNFNQGMSSNEKLIMVGVGVLGLIAFTGILLRGR